MTILKNINAFDKINKNYYTYQLKCSKGITVIIKEIEPNVDPEDIITV